MVKEPPTHGNTSAINRLDSIFPTGPRRGQARRCRTAARFCTGHGTSSASVADSSGFVPVADSLLPARGCHEPANGSQSGGIQVVHSGAEMKIRVRRAGDSGRAANPRRVPAANPAKSTAANPGAPRRTWLMRCGDRRRAGDAAADEPKIWPTGFSIGTLRTDHRTGRDSDPIRRRPESNSWGRLPAISPAPHPQGTNERSARRSRWTVMN